MVFFLSLKGLTSPHCLLVAHAKNIPARLDVKKSRPATPAVQAFGHEGRGALLAQDGFAIAVGAVRELVGDVGPYGVLYHGHADGLVGRRLAAGVKAFAHTDCRLVERRARVRPLEIVRGHDDTWVGQGRSICAVEGQASVWDAEARDVDAVVGQRDVSD